MLRFLPADHPQPARITQAYKKMMASPLKYQDKHGVLTGDLHGQASVLWCAAALLS
jgi:rhamnogalacturonyl hydrolase YesR